jgi:hypothetical protein
MTIQVTNLQNSQLTLTSIASVPIILKPFQTRRFDLDTLTQELIDLDATRKIQAEVVDPDIYLSTDEKVAVQVWATEPVLDTVSRNITSADNGRRLAPTQAITYTIPAGLLPKPSFSVDCPASGTISVARSGGATLNGGGTTLTRTRASNPVGFVVLAHTELDSYGVSGS